VLVVPRDGSPQTRSSSPTQRWHSGQHEGVTDQISATARAFRLDDKVALITGAGKGIGEATALAFADAGADIVLTARTEADLEAVAAQVRDRGRRALVVPGDVNDLDALAALVDATVGELGRLDVLVNNAGGSISRPFLQTSVRQLEKSFHFNISAAFELSRLCVPHMLEQGGGSIVNIGSTAGVKAERGTLTHSLTKSAVAQLTRLMAADLAPKVRVNGVLPGAIETAALLGYVDAETLARMVDKTAMRRNGQPDDIALAVLYFASPASSWVTGKLLEVDGLAGDDLVPKGIPDL
jgi:7-alpha-hydroxysteroid dehydrogenase